MIRPAFAIVVFVLLPIAAGANEPVPAVCGVAIANPFAMHASCEIGEYSCSGVLVGNSEIYAGSMRCVSETREGVVNAVVETGGQTAGTGALDACVLEGHFVTCHLPRRSE